MNTVNTIGFHAVYSVGSGARDFVFSGVREYAPQSASNEATNAENGRNRPRNT